MQVVNRASLSGERFQEVAEELQEHRSLLDVIKWSRKQPSGDLLPEVISELVVQDEFTHDLVVPWKNGLVIVYGTTCLGAITSISIWDHAPTAEELLAARHNEGWKPTASLLIDGPRVLGYAACDYPKRIDDSERE